MEAELAHRIKTAPAGASLDGSFQVDLVRSQLIAMYKSATDLSSGLIFNTQNVIEISIENEESVGYPVYGGGHGRTSTLLASAVIGVWCNSDPDNDRANIERAEGVIEELKFFEKDFSGWTFAGGDAKPKTEIQRSDVSSVIKRETTVDVAHALLIVSLMYKLTGD